MDLKSPLSTSQKKIERYTQEWINLHMAEGHNAFVKGLQSKPPYNKSSDEYRLWSRGYANARHMKALNDKYQG